MLTRLLTLVADRSPAGGGLALSAPPHLFPPVPGRPASRKYSPCSGRDFLRRSEEHTSELQSPCISYAVFCLNKKIDIVGRRVGSRHRRRLKPLQKVDKISVGIKSNFISNTANQICGVNVCILLQAMTKTTLTS